MENNQLVIIRHSESEGNCLNLFSGWFDIDISANGQEEAKKIGALLKERNFDFDYCFTSYLKRAIMTLYIIQNELDRLWLPTIKDWHLNERHYGRLQGINKLEAANIYGGDQVQYWRRNFTARPPELEEDDPQNPKLLAQYAHIKPEFLPLSESLSDTYDRVVPYYLDNILPKIKQGKKVLLVAHGNTSRVLLKYMEDLSEQEASEIYIPTGTPFAFDVDDRGKAISKEILGDQESFTQKLEKEVLFTEKLTQIEGQDYQEESSN